MADLSQMQWREQLENDAQAVVLDVRTDEETEQGIIPNALRIDIHQGQEFINEIQKLDTAKTYFVYCKSGGRSAQACAIMNQLGFEQTHNLIGGITDWRGAIVKP